jgi:serine/threonine-protein kinase
MSSLNPSDVVCNGRYEILEKIGAGGEGAIFLALDRTLNRKVAIKKIHAGSDASENKQNIDEASRLASLQHPNIVTVHDFIREPTGIMVVMEFLNGQNVDELPVPMSLDAFGKFAAQCLQGLSAAHAIGMIHRDIKPSNIIVLESSPGNIRVKILDFGLAKVIDKPSEQTKDHSGALLGSIFTMSPEQLRAEPIDFRSDLYSLGCVFYKALTKEHPFQGETVTAVITSHLQHELQPLASMRPDLPADITGWVERLSALDSAARPASATAALEELKSIQSALAKPSQRPRKPLPPNIVVHRHEGSPYVTLELQAIPA